MQPNNSLQQLLKEAILQIDQQAEVYLFGSRARGDANKFSDWDVLILSSSSVDEGAKELFRNKILEIELATDQIITSVIYEKRKWNDYAAMPLFQNIKNEGVLL